MEYLGDNKQYQREGWILAVQLLYAHEMGGSYNELINFSWLDDDMDTVADSSKDLARLLFFQVNKNRESLDLLINSCLKQWTMDRLRKVDLSILRLAAHYLKFEPGIPRAVIIDEMVGLARIFSGTQACGFINGVVDAMSRK
jgi:N utilization substance protein B